MGKPLRITIRKGELLTTDEGRTFALMENVHIMRRYCPGLKDFVDPAEFNKNQHYSRSHQKKVREEDSTRAAKQSRPYAFRKFSRKKPLENGASA